MRESFRRDVLSALVRFTGSIEYAYSWNVQSQMIHDQMADMNISERKVKRALSKLAKGGLVMERKASEHDVMYRPTMKGRREYRLWLGVR